MIKIRILFNIIMFNITIIFTIDDNINDNNNSYINVIFTQEYLVDILIIINYHHRINKTILIFRIHLKYNALKWKNTANITAIAKKFQKVLNFNNFHCFLGIEAYLSQICLPQDRSYFTKNLFESCLESVFVGQYSINIQEESDVHKFVKDGQSNSAK